MVYILAIQGKFYNNNKFYIVARQVWSPIILDSPFWHPFSFEILLNPQWKPSFIATFNLVKKADPTLPMLL